MHIGIAGAGLAGRLLALTCHQQGWEVTLFDKDARAGTQSCAYVGAGMITPYAEIETADPELIKMGLQSLTLWPKIIKSLSKSVYYSHCGSLLLSHAQDKSELLRFQQTLKNKFSKTITAVDVKEYEPELSSRFNQAYYFADEAHIDNTQLLRALEFELQQLGVTWFDETDVKHITKQSIHTADAEHEFNWVCDCRGLAAKDVLPELRGVRGELLYLHAPEVNLKHMLRLMHPRYAIYIVPREDNIFVVGASTIESEDDSPISLQTSLELLSAAYSVHSGFAEARIIETKVGVRPAFSNHMPRVQVEDRCLRINGLYRHGYLLAPSIVQQAISEMSS